MSLYVHFFENTRRFASTSPLCPAQGLHLLLQQAHRLLRDILLEADVTAG